MQTSDGYDWTSFDVHMRLPCNADTAYDCWATSAGMESFFAQTFTYTTADGIPREPKQRGQIGDAYNMAFHHPANLEGKVHVSEPGKQFAISFGGMRVTIFFEPSADRTLVRLVQSKIPTDGTGRAHSHLNCRCCWVYYLLNLRSVIEYGIDLRDGGLPDNPVGIDFSQRWQETQS